MGSLFLCKGKRKGTSRINFSLARNRKREGERAESAPLPHCFLEECPSELKSFLYRRRGGEEGFAHPPEAPFLSFSVEEGKRKEEKTRDNLSEKIEICTLRLFPSNQPCSRKERKGRKFYYVRPSLQKTLQKLLPSLEEGKEGVRGCTWGTSIA